MPEALGYSIDSMRREDVEGVLEIEREVFPVPWSRRAFLNEVEDRATSIARVARRSGRVIGYAIAWKVVDELHIGNLAVAPSDRRQGVGRAILDHVLGAAADLGLHYATLEVRVSNAAAISLYEACGFRPIALRRRFYPDNGEDAMVMLRDVASRPAREG
jgi:ribosomal-protein-alanine N-acetyltransferase